MQKGNATTVLPFLIVSMSGAYFEAKKERA